jgi:hypothetical protein
VGRARLILAVASTLAVSACAEHIPARPSTPMEAVLERAGAVARAPLGEWVRAGLQGSGTFGTGQPAAPVVIPPDVRRVWVPTHENAEGELVAGHWVFLRVRDARWFLDPSTGRGQSRAGGPPESPAARSEAGAEPVAGVPWVESPALGTSGEPRSGGSGTIPTSPTGGAVAPPPSTSPGTGRLP